MKIAIVQASKTNPMGNTVTVATLFKGRRIIGRCMDTPNAIATAVAHTKASRVVNGFGEKVKINASRVVDCAKNPLSFSGFVAA